MTRETIVITGASDGIGAQAARELHAQGHEVVIVGRSLEKTQRVANELGATFYICDYTDLDQVVTLAEQIRENHPHIDVLANNTGGIMGNRETTKDGFEKTFQVNHLAGFLLTHLLMDLLIESKATIIQTSSIAAKMFGRIDLDDLQLEKNYSADHAYGNGKLANILFTKELNRRFGKDGINAVAFHPGVVGTNFASETNHLMKFVYHSPIKSLATITPDKGADQLVWLATGEPGKDWEPGGYYIKRKLAKTNPQANDVVLAPLFWDATEKLLGIEH